jgi:hypothetical protein
MCAANNSNSDFSFDFGFTAVDEDDLDIAKVASDAECSAAAHEDRLNRLYEAILPLLHNLKKNPEKEYIKWPNRVKKVEEFESHISKIVNG